MWGIVDLVVDEPFDRQLIGGLIKRKRLIAVFVTFVVMVWISAYALAYKPCFEVVNTLISLFLFQGCFSFVLPFSPLSQ